MGGDHLIRPPPPGIWSPIHFKNYLHCKKDHTKILVPARTIQPKLIFTSSQFQFRPEPKFWIRCTPTYNDKRTVLLKQHNSNFNKCSTHFQEQNEQFWFVECCFTRLLYWVQFDTIFMMTISSIVLSMPSLRSLSTAVSSTCTLTVAAGRASKRASWQGKKKFHVAILSCTVLV